MAVVTFGTSYVGRVDRVAGRCYVVTKAFQIVNVPLVPLGSYLVAEGTETQTFVSGLTSFDGKELPLCWKSFGWGVARAILFGGGLLACLGLTAIWLGVSGVAAVLAGPALGIAMLATWWWTRRGLTASAERARELESVLASQGAAPLPRASVASL